MFGRFGLSLIRSIRKRFWCAYSETECALNLFEDESENGLLTTVSLQPRFRVSVSDEPRPFLFGIVTEDRPPTWFSVDSEADRGQWVSFLKSLPSFSDTVSFRTVIESVDSLASVMPQPSLSDLSHQPSLTNLTAGVEVQQTASETQTLSEDSNTVQVVLSLLVSVCSGCAESEQVQEQLARQQQLISELQQQLVMQQQQQQQQPQQQELGDQQQQQQQSVAAATQRSHLSDSSVSIEIHPDIAVSTDSVPDTNAVGLALAMAWRHIHQLRADNLVCCCFVLFCSFCVSVVSDLVMFLSLFIRY